MALSAVEQLNDLLSNKYISESEYIRRKIELDYDHLQSIFLYFDRDYDLSLSVMEFQTLISEIGEIMTEQQVRDSLNILSVKKNGYIDKEDFFQWCASPPTKSDNIVHERLRVIKSKLNSRLFMRRVVESRYRFNQPTPSPTTVIISDTDENLSLSVDVDCGKLPKTEMSIRLRHKRDPAAAAAFREILGKDQTYAVASLAFVCQPEINSTHLNEASKYLSDIMKNIMEDKKLPIEEFKWHLSEEQNVTYLRASSVLPVEVSMMGAGLLGSIGIQDLSLDLDFGGGCSKLLFKAAVSRGCIALVNDYIPNKDVNKFATFFLNYFCGANIKLQFTSIEEALSHMVASPLKFKCIDEPQLKTLLQICQKVVSPQTPNAQLILLQYIMDFMVSKEHRLRYFQAAWFATKCAKDNLEKLSSFTVVVGDELFEVDINIPKLLELLPTYDVAFNAGLFDKSKLPRKHIITNEEASLLPVQKKIEEHDHELTLKPKLFDWVEDYWCEECNSFGTGWCYCCPDCLYVIHPEHTKDDIK